MGDEGESGEDVGEFGFGQTVEMGNHAVQFGAQLRAGSGVRDAGLVAAQADFFGEGVKLRRGADQPRRPLHDWSKRRVRRRQARNGKLIHVEHVAVVRHLLADDEVDGEAVHHCGDEQKLRRILG